MSRVFLAILMLLSIPSLSYAVPAITCHCFTDRSYDPARPTLADPYFLATTQNAFFAIAFSVDKKSIVIKKQQGVSPEDLWIAYAVAANSGKTPESLLQGRKMKGSWCQVIPAQKIKGGRFAAAVKSSASDQLLAEAVVDDLLLRYRFYNESDLAAMHKTGIGSKELILAALLAAKVREPATQIYRTVASGSASWGGLLQRVKLTSSAEIQGALEKIMVQQK